MHLGNSIICPVTGIPMIIAMGSVLYYSFKKAKQDFKKENIPYIAALSAFVFALQMINFSIPETGSSGHVIGAVLLSALLGRYCAFISMCAILFVQSVFFFDGGLSAIGCNIFNMGFLACFVVYSFIYKPLADKNKIITASILASVIALQLGSLAVVLEGAVSGFLSGNIMNFLSLMQAIHLPIGIIEGLFTAAVVLFALKYQARKKLTYIFGGASLILAGIISQFASSKPDGLEWALLNVSSSITEQTQGYIYTISQMLQSKISVLANLNPVSAGILGVVIIAFLMMLTGKILAYNTIETNEH